MNRTFVVESLLGGILIGFGCIVNIVSGGGALGAFMFSLGLLSVIVFQAKLFTGRVGYCEPTFAHWLKVLMPMLLLNFIGIFLLCIAFANYSGLDLHERLG